MQNLSNVDEGGEEDRCPPNTASDSITFLNTFLVGMRMKFGMTRPHVAVYFNTSKSGDELISMKENVRTVLRKGQNNITTSLCDGRADQHLPRACVVSEQCSGLCGRSCMDCAYRNQVSWMQMSYPRCQLSVW